MVDLEPRMSFSKNHAAERSEVTQGGVEGSQGTQDRPLELYSTPKTMCGYPIHNGTGTCGPFFDPTQRLARILTSEGESPGLN